MSTNKIWLSPPHMSGEERKYVEEAFETNWISPVGPHITAFEDELAVYSGVPHCAALASGTAAIHLALVILGVRTGDEVVCSSFTFSGSCNPVAYVGATPVFVDSESDTWNMSPVFLRQAIEDRIRKTGKKPKAIIIVHLYGMPAKIDEIMQVADEFGIPVVEDAAEALGSSFNGQKLGSFGHFGVFSFNGNKIITTSGGGALLSKNGDFIKQARFLATQARENAPHYEHKTIGFNYRLSNVCAAIGRGQMTVLDDRVEKRRKIFDFYREKLEKTGKFTFLQEGEGSYSNRWLTTTIVAGGESARERLRLTLEQENIESRPLWKPMHLQPVFLKNPYYGDHASDAFFESGLCLPSGTALSDAELGRIIKVILATV